MNFPDWLHERSKSPLPGAAAHSLMMPQDVDRPEAKDAPATARQSAVLMLLYQEQAIWKIVLIVRTIDDGPHSGQLALPGGRVEPEDENLIATALRESNEEVALPLAAAQYIATLSPLYIPVSNFLVTPVVAYASQLPKLLPSDAEVADIIYVSLQDMFDTVAEVEIETARGTWLTKAYTVAGDKIVWGATAMMLAELGVLWEEYKYLNSYW